jgi:hypothetical protein
VPALNLIIKMFDRVSRGAPPSHARELARWLDSYGVTPKGQQQRHWLPPNRDELDPQPAGKHAGPSPYSHLRLVDEHGAPLTPA